jgi:sulfur-oxidizing protein SoxZ
MAKIKIRAKTSDGVTEVKALMDHPMETGLRKDSDGNVIPEHFIQEVTCDYGGKTVMTCHWGPAVSKNPYMSFSFKGGAKGDKIVVSWVDNMGETATEEAEIK